MRTMPLFDIYPEFAKEWISLIKEATPAHALKHFGQIYQHENLFIKREDLTSLHYGGNKVRNLEFLLGQAQKQKSQIVLSLAPLGSNFTAALSAQAEQVGIPVKSFHFTPHLSQQMIQHAKFSASHGAQLKTYRGGYLPSLVHSSLDFASHVFLQHSRSFIMPTGGSDARGALGHVNAFLEMLEQVKNNQIADPQILVVGAGTCGTMAGLVAAKVLTGHPVKIIGVRCVDRIVCNTWRIAHLTNQVLGLLNSRQKVAAYEIELVDVGTIKYGQTHERAGELKKIFQETEAITLDTTYTTKVVSHLVSLLLNPDLKNKNILYWHTFSDAAVRYVPQTDNRQIPLHCNALSVHHKLLETISKLVLR